MTETDSPHIETVDTRETEQKKLLFTTLVQQRIDILSSVGITTKSDSKKIVDQTVRVLTFFEIDEAFFLSSEGNARPFLLLGLVDEWLQNPHLDAQKGLFDTIKILTSDEWQGRTHSSQRVLRQAAADKKLGYEFVSGYKQGQSADEWGKNDKYANAHIDHEKTAELQKQISSPDDKASFLHQIRLQLKITKTERPFTVKVLTKTAEEMAAELNGVIAFFSKGSLCVGSDYDLHIVEHEYIHSQQPGFNFGSNGSLGRGLMEGWTEMQTQNPEYYRPQRKVLSVIIEKAPHFVDLLTKYGLSVTYANFDAIYMQLLSSFGLEGSLAAIRMVSAGTCASDDSTHYHGKYVFRDTDEVERKLQSTHLPADAQRARDLGDLNLYLDTDALILRHKLKHEADKQTTAELEKIKKTLARIEFETALAKLITCNPGEKDYETHLLSAISIYSEHFMERDYHFDTIVLELIKLQSTPEKDAIFQKIIAILESKANQDFFTIAVQFLAEISGTYLDFSGDNQNSVWNQIIELKQKLRKEFFNRHQDDYRFGYLILADFKIDKDSPESQSKLLTYWEQTKASILATLDASSQTDLHFDPEKLIYMARKLSRVSFSFLDQNQISNIVGDIFWLLTIAQQTPNFSADDQDYLHSEYEAIVVKLTPLGILFPTLPLSQNTSPQL